MSKKIIRNLIDFYKAFNEKMLYFEDTAFYTFLSKWPNCNINKPNNLLDFTDFNNKKYSKNWILSEDFTNKNKTGIKDAKLFPVSSWTNMFLSKKQLFLKTKIPNFTVELLKEKDIADFITVVNASFNKEILHYNQVKEKLNHTDFLFVTGKFQQKLVTTAVFFNNGQTVGLYFIATAKEHQKKGYGTETIKQGINHILSEIPTEFVLHATFAGKKMYENIGFTAVNKMRIFVKI